MFKGLRLRPLEPIKMIEVFAYWNPLGDGKYSRNGTLIVSGGCDTVVGNAILKNPGSARPIKEEPSLWYGGRLPFRPDATMYALADLFELGKRPGTVRLFNLLDYVDTDPAKARVIGLLISDDVLGTVTEGDVPTYIGWGDNWKDMSLTGLCEQIFNAVLPYSPYLSPEMEKNVFLHPLYLMRYGRGRQICEDMISSFSRLL